MDFVNMTPKDLASEAKKKAIEQSQKANIDSKRTDWAMEEARKNKNNVGFFTCKKCQSKNTTYF